MHPTNDVWWNLSLKIGEGLKRHDAFIGGVNSSVIAHSFDVNYFPQENFFQTVFCFYKNKIFRNGNLFSRQIALHTVNRLNEPFKRERFQKIIRNF